MTGETEKDVSGWTVDTLRANFDRQLTDMRILLDERYDTQTKALEAAFAAAERAVAAALLSAEKAVGKAELAADKRFESVNEFRAQLADQASTFMPRIEAEARLNSFDQQLRTLNQIVTRGQGKTSGIDKTYGILVGLAGMAIAVISIIIALKS